MQLSDSLINSSDKMNQVTEMYFSKCLQKGDFKVRRPMD